MKKLDGMKGYIRHLIEDEVVDLENPLCVNCNECCGITTAITDVEWAFYRRYFSKNKIGKDIFQRAKKRYIKNWSSEPINFMCPFSTPNKKCEIYSIRPQVCKDFHCKKDLWGENYDPDKIRFRTHGRCIDDLFGGILDRICKK